MDKPFSVKISQLESCYRRLRDIFIKQGARGRFKDIDELTEDNITQLLSFFVLAFPPSIRRNLGFRDALKKSLCNFLVGNSLTGRAAESASYMLAGNLTDLSRGIPVVPWSTRASTNMCAVRIINVLATRNDIYQRVDHIVRMRVLTGASAGAMIDIGASRKFLNFLYVTSGVRSYRPSSRLSFDKLKTYPRELSYCYLAVKVSVTPDSNLKVSDFSVTSSMSTRNRALAEKRVNLSRDERCVGLKPCSLCPVGLESCTLACHPKDGVAGGCTLCLETELVDPDYTKSISFECQRRLESN